MKTRTVVHIALNAKNERVGILIEAAGRLIPFDGGSLHRSSDRWRKRRSIEWLIHGYSDGYSLYPSLKKWKKESAELYNAVRFQRVTLIGESK